ncbi:MAG: hypothetical protein GC189_06065 [Alphaproteobacteria bacterium]|nr:hypothetical protein [Alphaproteobacteria bacterium]
MAAEALDLARIAQQLQTAAPRPAERRRFRRLNLAVPGRLLDERGREQACRTADISPGDVRLAAPEGLSPGERVVIYLDEIGRVSGRVARACGEKDMAVIFDVSPLKREKLAEVLTFMAARETLGLEREERPHIDAPDRVIVRIEDHDEIEGEAVDVSLTGMIIRTRWPAPPIGAWAQVGMTHGRVSEHLSDGFAIDFTSMQSI